MQKRYRERGKKYVLKTELAILWSNGQRWHKERVSLHGNVKS